VDLNRSAPLDWRATNYKFECPFKRADIAEPSGERDSRDPAVLVSYELFGTFDSQRTDPIAESDSHFGMEVGREILRFEPRYSGDISELDALKATILDVLFDALQTWVVQKCRVSERINRA